jgi:hypothetical protein
VITDILIDPVRDDARRRRISRRPAGRPEMFMIADSDDELAEARRAYARDTRRFPKTKIVRRTPRRRDASVEWLQARYDLRFLDEEFG